MDFGYQISWMQIEPWTEKVFMIDLNYKFCHDYVVVIFKELYFHFTANILAYNISRRLNVLITHELVR